MVGIRNSRRKMKPAGIVLLALGSGLTGYWAWTYTGIYRWLAELQLRMMHEYEVQLTFVITLMIVLGPLFLVSEVIRRFVLARAGKDSGESGAAASVIATNDRPSPLMMGLTAGGTVGLVGLGFAVVGGYQYHQGMTAGNIVHVDVSAYETGQAPAAMYVSVTGQSIHDATEGVKDTSASTKYYMPLVSADWDSSKPVGLFLETTAANMMDSNAVQRGQPDGKTLPEVWVGMIDTDGLPGLVRTRFEDDHAVLAPGYVVLSVGETPRKKMDKARVLMCIGGGVFAFGAIIGLVTSWRIRKALSSETELATPQKADPRLEIKSVIDFNRKGQP